MRANLGGPVNLRVGKILFRFCAHFCLYMREEGSILGSALFKINIDDLPWVMSQMQDN